MCIHIHIYTHIHTYIYIYIIHVTRTQRARSWRLSRTGESPGAAWTGAASYNICCCFCFPPGAVLWNYAIWNYESWNYESYNMIMRFAILEMKVTIWWWNYNYNRIMISNYNFAWGCLVRSVVILSTRKIYNWASQILKANMLLMCPYCLEFQIARV